MPSGESGVSRNLAVSKRMGYETLEIFRSRGAWQVTCLVSGPVSHPSGFETEKLVVRLSQRPGVVHSIGLANGFRFGGRLHQLFSEQLQ